MFELNANETLENKYNLILKRINESGFKNSANIFSISSSSKFGGDLGWISETQLNEILLKEIKSVDVNKLTKPIQATNGRAEAEPAAVVAECPRRLVAQPDEQTAEQLGRVAGAPACVSDGKKLGSIY